MTRTSTPVTPHDESHHDDFESIHKSIRRASAIVVVCCLFIAAILFRFSEKIAKTSNAREQLISELHANETSKRLAERILVQVDKARRQENISDMWDQLDNIETLATSVINGE